MQIRIAGHDSTKIYAIYSCAFHCIIIASVHRIIIATMMVTSARALAI